jgi:hypothetical protein
VRLKTGLGVAQVVISVQAVIRPELNPKKLEDRKAHSLSLSGDDEGKDEKYGGGEYNERP